MNYRFSSIVDSVKSLLFSKYPLIFIAAIASYQTYAAPSNMGSITVTSSNASTGTASGTYIAAGSGATGTFTLVRNENIGYNNNAEITPTSGTRTNGIEIRNDSNTSIDADKFKYTFTIVPDDNNAIHTIKIGQASYAQSGNSEIARHTLAFTANSQINIPVQATIKNNPSVPYYYNAMGDYFMGSRVNNTQINSQSAVSDPQLRVNSSTASGSGLYYYNIPNLTGVTSNANPYTPTLTNNQVALSSNNGMLPPTPTFINIFKSTSTNPNNQTTYGALNQNTVISNGGTYVSYGIENSQSNYVIAVKNAQSVILTYEGIMNGNIGIPRAVVGETFNEWISFGVESEPLNYVFSGTVFNDNGGINDSVAAIDKVGTPYSNNSNYFNGNFDNNESGVLVKTGSTGSRIRLLKNCNTPNPTAIATQTLTTADAGVYRFSVLATAINRNDAICIVEDNNSDYPIRTTSDKQNIEFIASNYSYLDNNFGRVIEANKALVLTKYQYINKCPDTLDYPNISSQSADTPLTGFSTKEISRITPGQCIAYKITATNRSNLTINNFVMSDTLQKAGIGNATVSSKLTGPTYNSNDYATDSVAIGNNNVPVKTIQLSISPKSQKIFYFNTKYDSTNSNP